MNLTLENKKLKGLTETKKELFKKFIGHSSSRIDLNKVREEWKNGDN